MNKFVVVFALAVVGCDGGASGSGGGGDKPAADGLTQVPNINGVRAKVPAAAVPNGVGGAAGFHSKDDSFGFTLQEIPAGDTKDIEAAKKEAEELMFKKWIKSEKTDDGWVLVYESPKLDLSGEEAKEVGVTYSFEVRRKVGDKTLKCYGALDKTENADAAVAACQSLAAG